MTEENNKSRNLLSSPTYCLGSLFLPEDQVCQWIQAFDYSADADFWESPEEQQLLRFKEFLGWLVDKQCLSSTSSSLKVISPTYWLQGQKRLADELKAEGLPAELEEKAAVVKTFLSKK